MLLDRRVEKVTVAREDAVLQCVYGCHFLPGEIEKRCFTRSGIGSMKIIVVGGPIDVQMLPDESCDFCDTLTDGEIFAVDWQCVVKM